MTTLSTSISQTSSSHRGPLPSLRKYRLLARIEKIWRWEFWPMWLFYLPIVPWVLYLCVRYRGLSTITAANPGIPHGGVVGESKFDILHKLPREWIVPSRRINAEPIGKRLEALQEFMTAERLAFPVILKPDASQRGAGVKLIHSLEQAKSYLAVHADISVVVQGYHVGPFEAGIFYYRLPDEPRGRILSITDKQFSYVFGDGESTLEELIWRHPRYRMQAERFLDRWRDQKDRVLEKDDSFRLAMAGNHCQGTLFRDGAHLLTPELEQSIDSIARHFDGFYFGRFDVRYADENEFKVGRGFSIVELNGVTSESTNIYDPTWPLVRAYQTLYRQWSVLFEVGYQNRRRNVPVSTLGTLWREIRGYYRCRSISPLSD